MAEAKAYFLSVVFLAKPVSERLFVGLSAATRVMPQTLVEAGAREPTRQEGYRRQALGKDDWTFEGNGVIVSKAVTFRNDGRELWPELAFSFLATTEDNSGVLLAWAALDRARMQFPGDELVLPLRIRF